MSVNQNPPPSSTPKSGNRVLDAFLPRLQKALYLLWVQVGKGTGIATFNTIILSTDFQVAKTITAGGTTGAQTINKTAGSVNFAASSASLVVTNSLVDTNSVIMASVGTNDSTMKAVQVVAGSGSFTLHADAVPTGETRVNFMVIN